jgi:hypothetical protein
MTSVDKLNDLRRRILDGEEPSRDELRAAITALVGERLEAHTKQKTTRSRAKSTPIALDDLL